jgi:hypothetical protein
MSKQINATVEDEVHAHLTKVAKEQDRNLGQQVARILRHWVADDQDAVEVERTHAAWDDIKSGADVGRGLLADEQVDPG